MARPADEIFPAVGSIISTHRDRFGRTYSATAGPLGRSKLAPSPYYADIAFPEVGGLHHRYERRAA
jgi:hypothetical protein